MPRGIAVSLWPLGVRVTRSTALLSKGRWSGRGHTPQGMTDLGHCPCAATHLGGVLLSDNGSGRARSGYPPPVMLKWDLGCARAEEVITDQGGLVLKRS
ncbi:hypothetical protein QQF64_008691 [Cirrhinus molitorella]|uniref:Uncharacterized protein n=1 Tax=Cirrhinus molitorella TaxID=172907 RepID=A0ABR3MA85_9TELE